jgi:type IV pilus assembly protein PilM
MKGREVSEILFTGEMANFNRLAEDLCQQLNRTLLIPQENPNFSMNVQELQRFALPIGAALSALPNCKEEINFRQREFTYPFPWKRLKRPIATYLTLCVAIAGALLLLGKTYHGYREAQVKLHYLELLNVMNRSYSDVEKEYGRKKDIEYDDASKKVIKIEDLSQNEIKGRLSFLEKQIKASPETFPLQPNVPLVSDVHAWLSTHPSITGKKNSDELGFPETLKIENFSYLILKRPEQSKKQEKYQVKVEIEFTTPTPKLAREFHDALIAPNDIVDSKGEIKWSSNRDKYKTSFYLRDKTIYPTP